MIFTTTGDNGHPQEQEIEAESALEACVAHVDRFGVCPDEVEDEDGTVLIVYGPCEACSLPILDGDDSEGSWYRDSEGVIWHEVCPERPAGGGE
jgi:hypothetical protein